MRRSSRKRVLADVSTRANSHTSPSPTFSSIAAVPSTRSSSAPVGASPRFDGVEAEIQKDEAKNALTEAAQSGNAAECRRLLREGRNDARSDGSGTRSAQNGKAQKRESNFDPNQRWHGWTPLMHAAAHGFVDVLAALLADSRVEVDAGDTEFGATALLLAAGNGQVGAVRLLLEDGRAEPNATAFDGSTALSRATYTAARGSTAPHLANVRKRALDVIRLMLSDPRIDPNCTPQVRITLPFSTDAIEAKSDREGKDLRQKDGMDNEIHGTNNSAIPSSNSNFSRCSSGGSSSSMEGATALKQQLQLRRSGTTALMFAVGSGDLTLVEALLSSNKLDPNVRSTSQMRTALHRAASHGFTTIVASFLRDGRADPSLEDANGNTALIIAADKGHLGVVNMLLGGVDVTECTPGVFCKEFDVDEEEYEEEEDCKKAESCRGRKRKRQQQIASTKLILMVGQTELDRKGTVVLPAETRLRADPTRQQQVETDKQQQQRQHYWSEASKNRVSPNTENRNGSTALIHAACHGHCRVVQRLLADERTDPNKTSTYNGNTALGWAANRGHCDVVAALLADDRTAANASDQKNRTALARAAQKGHWKVVQEMLKHASVDRNARDFRGHTALIHAVGYHHKEVVQLLLADPQVDPNASGYHHDRTALHRCASLGFGAMVQLLLGDERLDTNKSDCQGCTALYHAAVMGHSGCTETLLGDERVDLNQANVNGHTPLYAAAEKGHAPVVSSLLADPRVDPMSVTEGGFTALTGAAHYGHTSVVDIFLRDGRVDPNGANEQGITALTYAAHKGHAEVVKVLLGDERVDPNIADNRNCGSLYHAASLGHTKAVAALLADKRVDLNVVCTSNRRTALMRALQKEHIAVAELLLADGRCMRPRVVDTVVGEPLPAEAMHATGVGAETQDATDMQAAGGTVGENGSSSSSSTDPSTVEPVSIFSSRSSQPQRLRTLGVITGEVARSCYRSALRHVKRPRLARFRGIVRCLIQLKKLRLRAAERAYAPPPTCSTRDGGFMLYANNAACTSSPTCLVETAADRTEQREVQQQDVSRVTNTAKECKQNAITEHEEESNDSVADLDESVSTIITNTGSIWDETTLERHVSSNSDRMESDSDNASCDESFELAQLTDGLEDDLSYEVGMIGTARTENAMTTRRSSKRRRIDDISTDSKGAAGSSSSHERIGGAGFFAAERDFNARVRKFA